MALTKEVSVHSIKVREDGQMLVRTLTKVLEDGVFIGQSFKDKLIDVGDDTTGEDQLVIDTAATMHTPERKAARDLVKAAQAVGPELDPSEL